VFLLNAERFRLAAPDSSPLVANFNQGRHTVGKNQNTFEKRRREVEKRQRAEEKRKRRQQKKDEPANPSSVPIVLRDGELVAEEDAEQ
jgi:hypothetical protein